MAQLLPDIMPREVLRSLFPVKRLPDGRALLNLACGTRMHHGWSNLDFSPYARLAHRPRLTSMLKAFGMLSNERLQRLAEVDPEIIAWDLRNGIPFAPNTFDVVYHSHFLEHIDRHHAPGLLNQCYRALKPGGIIRVVVPDLELLVNDYLSSLRNFKGETVNALDQHHLTIANLFDQMVRRDSTGTTLQKPIVRLIEACIRGGADKTGELHRWMYDQFTLGELLLKTGFQTVQRHTASSSGIRDWVTFNLDTNADGSVYKPESLYMEAVK